MSSKNLTYTWPWPLLSKQSNNLLRPLPRVQHAMDTVDTMDDYDSYCSDQEGDEFDEDLYSAEYLLQDSDGQETPDLLYYTVIITPLGDMLAIADSQALHFLHFADLYDSATALQLLTKKNNYSIIKGVNRILQRLQYELDGYFQGTIQAFTVPYITHGSPFAKNVWASLRTIDYGTTQSYSWLALCVAQKTSFARAVAQANACNLLAIIIPCHRVIHAKGTLSGYAGGTQRKQWLIEHETRVLKAQKHL